MYYIYKDFLLHISKMSRENGYGSSDEGEHESLHARDGHLRGRNYRSLRGLSRGDRHSHGDRRHHQRIVSQIHHL